MIDLAETVLKAGLAAAAGRMSGMTAAGSSDDYEIRTEISDMDLDRIHHWLSTDAYWALGRTRDNIETAARNSLNFGTFTRDGRQVAYARVLTDHANFGWLCDVYVDRDHRGRGLGIRLVDAVIRHLEPIGLKRVLLATGDAHEVYARFGFTPLPHPDNFMILEAPVTPGPE
jgi:GNAT superfamily N-acetyltransferase